MDSPLPSNWINRRFVARPGSQLLFTRCRYPSRGGAMMYVARDLYLFREDILNERGKADEVTFAYDTRICGSFRSCADLSQDIMRD